MTKIAIFGKPGSGKSTLGNTLGLQRGLPYYCLDSIAYTAEGEQVNRAQYAETYHRLIAQEDWIIDGLGPVSQFYERLELADVLIYIDLPYLTSYWLVTKRLLLGVIRKPTGWPKGASLLKGTRESYRFLGLSKQFWNADFLARLKDLEETRQVIVIRNLRQLSNTTMMNAKINASHTPP